MRRLLILLVAGLLLAAGCADPSVTTEADDEGGSEAQEAQTEQTEQAAVGDGITLSGTSDSLQVRVTVRAVADPATPGDDFSTPDEGNRFVGIQVLLENVGEDVYDDSPGNGATLVDDQSEQYDESLIADIAEGQGFGGGVTLNAGSERSGWLVFELPEDRSPETFQFALDSGFADQTGEWSLS